MNAVHISTVRKMLQAPDPRRHHPLGEVGGDTALAPMRLAPL